MIIIHAKQMSRQFSLKSFYGCTMQILPTEREPLKAMPFNDFIQIIRKSLVAAHQIEMPLNVLIL